MLKRALPPAEPWWRDITGASLRADLFAGLLCAMLVLPQGVAFARLAGLPVEFGIYSSILPCIVAALFGSSRHVHSGPTNANSLAIFAMLSPLALPGTPDYIQLVLAATLTVGVIQLLVAVFRLGIIADFIAPSVLTGFMAGAACLIAYHAAIDLHALSVRPGGFAYLDLLVAALTLAVTALTMRLKPRWPAMLAGLAAGTVLAVASEQFGGPAAAELGAIAAFLPPLTVPSLDGEMVGRMMGIGLALAVVSLGQSISIAKAIGERSGQHVDANREFLGQGLANIVASFSSAYVCCGSLNRSMPNFEAGARTPLAAVFSALLVLALLALCGSQMAHIPLAGIAALLLVVSWTLIDRRKIARTLRFGRQEAACLIVTWAAVLLTRIELAILIGVGLSLLFYLYQTSRPAMRVLVPAGEGRRFTPLEELPQPMPECPQLKLLRMEGSVYFGAAPHVRDTLRRYRESSPGQKHLLVMVKSMNVNDQAGEQVWHAEYLKREAMGGKIYFHRPRSRVLEAWARGGLQPLLEADGRIFQRKHAALCAIVPTLDQAICAKCCARIFLECPPEPAGAHPAG